MNYRPQPDGSIWFRRRGPPPEPPPGYVRSDDPYVMVPRPCVHLEAQARKVSCCSHTFNHCHFYHEDIQLDKCMNCQYKK